MTIESDKYCEQGDWFWRASIWRDSTIVLFEFVTAAYIPMLPNIFFYELKGDVQNMRTTLVRN